MLNKKTKLILGIETSCDDNSIAVLANEKVLAQTTYNNHDILQAYGGVVPEIVSRFHTQTILDNLKTTLNKAQINLTAVNEIAYTFTPGLKTSLLVGEMLAWTLASFLQIPVFPINHIYGHILSPWINQPFFLIPLSFLALIASGKTTSIFLVENITQITTLSMTVDDAIGESLDKVGRALGFPYPGGVYMDQSFRVQDAIFPFPKMNLSKPFSFSGIKNYAFNLIKQVANKQQVYQNNIASSFVKATIDYLIDKLQYHQKKHNIKAISIGGGVAANRYFQTRLANLFDQVYMPQKKYTTDNAAMIAYVRYCQTQNNKKPCN